MPPNPVIEDLNVFKRRFVVQRIAMHGNASVLLSKGGKERFCHSFVLEASSACIDFPQKIWMYGTRRLKTYQPKLLCSIVVAFCCT
jgi:hypothetical protein